jgi:hypothetical protein
MSSLDFNIKNHPLKLLDQLQLISYFEGLSMQTLGGNPIRLIAR